MTGYSPTHIPIPKNHADFERKATVLFREILKDPDAKRLGSEGQSQYGIDIVGFDGGNTSRIVGIQCKKKKPNEILTAKEVRDELRMALKYKPAICKYIIVTTARKDRRLEQLAQTLTQQQKVKGRKVKVEVWGWDLVEDRIDDYPMLDLCRLIFFRRQPDPQHRGQRRALGGVVGDRLVLRHQGLAAAGRHVHRRRQVAADPDARHQGRQGVIRGDADRAQ
jgi:Restriction endonuclease